MRVRRLNDDYENADRIENGDKAPGAVFNAATEKSRIRHNKKGLSVKLISERFGITMEIWHVK